MLRKIAIVLLCLSTLVAFGQSSKYQVGTIVKVKPHAAATEDATDIATYEVSVKVKETVYVVLYTPPELTDTIKYVAGREILVSVGDKTVKYNDQLGQTIELPILNRETAAVGKKSN